MKPIKKNASKAAAKPTPTQAPVQPDNTPGTGNGEARKSRPSVNQAAERDGKLPPVPAPGTVRVGFNLFEPTAKRVALCSDFNGWSSETTAMNRVGEGRWSVTVDLKPGRYQYKFLVDGEWRPDPEARENLVNQFGTLNSVIEIQA